MNSGLRNTVPDATPATFTELATDRYDQRTDRAIACFRRQWLLEMLDAHGSEIPADLLMAALREAEALASLTPWPDLFLPALADEKVAALRKWWVRQQQMRQQEISFPA
ncbi:MAG: hypothetical protein KF791_13575 [Verrucomicrobiae bacterium]|nr:hypothetical protein [Verrucomicrobiae bacterium]